MLALSNVYELKSECISMYAHWNPHSIADALEFTSLWRWSRFLWVTLFYFLQFPHKNLTGVKYLSNSKLQNIINMFRIFSKIIRSHFLTNLYATCNFRIANTTQLQSAKCTKDVQKNDIDWALPKEMALLHHRVNMVLHLKRSDHKI